MSSSGGDASLLIGTALALAALPVTVAIARRRGHRIGRWLLLSVFLWPVSIGLLLVLPRGRADTGTTAMEGTAASDEALIVLGFGCFAVLGCMGVYAGLR